MKKKLKIIILVLLILLVIILLRILIFYKSSHRNVSKPYISNPELTLNKKNKEEINYEEAINEVEIQVQQEFNRIDETYKNELYIL